MLMRELLERAGITRDTVRHYLKIGLLTEAHYTTLPNGYRDFNEAALERLTFIYYGRKAGFTLAQIASVADRWQSDELSYADKQDLLAQQLTAIDRRIAELEALKQGIATILRKEAARTPA